MYRCSRAITAIAFAITMSVLNQDTGNANDKTPIFIAANQYRLAIRNFERQVLRSPNIRNSIERLVDDLENSTVFLRSAARDPGRFDRLYQRFVATDRLHSKVGLVFFGDPLFYPGPELESCWVAADQAYLEFSRQLQFLKRLRNAKRGIHAPIIDRSQPTVLGAVVPPSPGLLSLQRDVGTGVASPQTVTGVELSSPMDPLATMQSAVDAAASDVGPVTGPSGRFPTPSRRIETRQQLEQAVLNALRRAR